jgi:hypothetical protein
VPVPPTALFQNEPIMARGAPDSLMAYQEYPLR